MIKWLVELEVQIRPGTYRLQKFRLKATSPSLAQEGAKQLAAKAGLTVRQALTPRRIYP